jgi:toxin ParE1/3/4
VTRARVVFSEHADSDLRDLFNYIVEQSGYDASARRFIDGIVDRCAELQDFPQIGRPRDDLQVGLRLLTFKSVVIAYRLEARSVIILNIFARGRDFEAILRGQT